jgi:hypothetical protein
VTPPTDKEEDETPEALEKVYCTLYSLPIFNEIA